MLIQFDFLFLTVPWIGTIKSTPLYAWEPDCCIFGRNEDRRKALCCRRVQEFQVPVPVVTIGRKEGLIVAESVYERLNDLAVVLSIATHVLSWQKGLL